MLEPAREEEGKGQQGILCFRLGMLLQMCCCCQPLQSCPPVPEGFPGTSLRLSAAQVTFASVTLQTCPPEEAWWASSRSAHPIPLAALGRCVPLLFPTVADRSNLKDGVTGDAVCPAGSTVCLHGGQQWQADPALAARLLSVSVPVV